MRSGIAYELFCGVDDLVLESVLLGATGWIAGMGLAFPKENQLFWDLAIAGDYKAAREALCVVHAAPAPRYASEVRPVHQTCYPGNRPGRRMGARATPASRGR